MKLVREFEVGDILEERSGKLVKVLIPNYYGWVYCKTIDLDLEELISPNNLKLHNEKFT